MTTRVAADAEGIVIFILLDNVDVVAAVDDRIGTELDLTKPESLPALRISTVSTRSIARRQLDGVSVQLEAWHNSRIEAKDLLELARGALLEDGLEGHYPGLGVLSGIDDGTGPLPRPDPETDTARWLCTVVVYCHPAPAGSDGSSGS